MALLFTWGIVHGSLHRSLAIDPLVHLAITQPPVDMLAGEIDRVLAGHLVHLGPANVVVDCLSYPSAIEGLHVVKNTTVCPVLTEWLSVVAPQLDWTVVSSLVLPLCMYLGLPRHFVAHSALCCTCDRVSL